MKIVRILCLIASFLSYPAWGVLELEEKDIIRVLDKGEIEKFKTWLNQGLDINWVDYKKRSLLERVAGQGHEAMVDELLKRGATVNQEDQEGNTALYMAVRGGHINIARKLIAHKANVNQLDHRGVGALYMASKKGFDQIVDLLCIHGASMTSVIKETQETPLWIAAKEGHFSVARVLLSYGANPNQGDYKGITPLLISSYLGHEEVALDLLRHKANPDQARDNGITPLMVASYIGHPHLVQALINRGARLDISAPPELGGGQALHYALQSKQNITQKQYDAVVDILEEAIAQRKQIQEQEKFIVLEQQILNLQTILFKLSQSQEDIKINQAKEIHTLTNQMYSLSPPSMRSNMEAEVDLLKTQQNVLWKKHIQEQDIQKHKTYLMKDESLSIFYTTFQRKLSQLFLAYKVLETGMIEQTKTTLNKIADGISLLGEIIDIPVIKHIPKVVSTALNFYADKREEKKVSLVARLTNSLSDMEKEVEESSRLIAYRYQDQIKALTSKGSQILAECGVRRLIEYIRDDNIDQSDSLFVQLTYALSIHNSHQGLIPFTNKALETKNNEKKWTDDGVFRKTGIKTEKGETFSSTGVKVSKYGYRLGTREEAESLGFQKKIE